MKFYHLLSSYVVIAILLIGWENATFASVDHAEIPPANSPAKIRTEGKKIIIEYEGNELFKGELSYMESAVSFNQKVVEQEGKVTQVFRWGNEFGNKPMKLTGIIYASNQSFPCEADKPHSSKNIVRNSIGLSNSLLNRAVYDRKGDWALSVNQISSVRITPVSDNGNSHQFKIEIMGGFIELCFRPLYYQKHRGLSYYQPWTYDVWEPSVAGWCSWFAYFGDISERDIKHTADVVSQELVPYGFDYLQIDLGYSQEPEGLPETWLTGNEKFPSGLDHLSNYIQKKGLKPGIWTNACFKQEEFAFDNKDLFVRDRSGNPAYADWVGYVMDGSNTNTLNTIIKPIYKGLKEMGWEYYKLDGMRHLRYEGYNAYNDYFVENDIDPIKAYRNLAQAIRDEIGENNFMLACWGIRPELIGIIDACRIGGDGFGYAGLSQYNSFNNVVWRNDPDHIVLSEEEAYPSCMVTSMTGSLFMLTDKPEVYTTEVVDAAKRSVPVMFTQPGQIYDVDPSRSSNIYRVDSEIKGTGPRVFDAGQNGNKDYLYLLEINKIFENWMLLGRIGGVQQTISFRELGLDNEKEYFVFEFWTKKLIGSFVKAFETGKMNSKYNAQLFCIRERKEHPQIIATNRHITCGAYDLIDLKWENLILSGKSKIVNGEEYKLYIAEPYSYSCMKFDCDKAQILGNSKNGIVREISLKPDTDGPINWSVTYNYK